MHIRKMTQVKKASEAWSLVDLMYAFISLLQIDSAFGKDFEKPEEEEEVAQ